MPFTSTMWRLGFTGAACSCFTFTRPAAGADFKLDTKLTKTLQLSIQSVLGADCFRTPKDEVLMHAAAMVMDATDQNARLKVALEAVRGELRTLAVLQMRQRGVSRLVLTKAELDTVPMDTEVHVESPEPGVRIYEIKTKAKVLNG